MELLDRYSHNLQELCIMLKFENAGLKQLKVSLQFKG